MYHVHFGVLGTHEFYAAEIAVPDLGYCSALASPLEFKTLSGLTAYIEGSWTDWGPDGYDQEDTLHVVVEFDHKPSSEEILTARRDLHARLFRESRLVDYAVITTKEDWSDVRGVATFTSMPQVVVFSSRLGWEAGADV